MKNILIPVTIFVLIVSSVTVSLVFLKSSTKELTDILSRADTAAKAEDFTACQQYLTEFHDRYEDFDGIYTIVIRHIEMDEIQTFLSKAMEYAKAGEKGLTTGEISALTARVEHLYETERIDFYNVV